MTYYCVESLSRIEVMLTISIRRVTVVPIQPRLACKGAIRCHGDVGIPHDLRTPHMLASKDHHIIRFIRFRSSNFVVKCYWASAIDRLRARRPTLGIAQPRQKCGLSKAAEKKNSTKLRMLREKTSETTICCSYTSTGVNHTSLFLWNAPFRSRNPCSLLHTRDVVGSKFEPRWILWPSNNIHIHLEKWSYQVTKPKSQQAKPKLARSQTIAAFLLWPKLKWPKWTMPSPGANPAAWASVPSTCNVSSWRFRTSPGIKSRLPSHGIRWWIAGWLVVDLPPLKNMSQLGWWHSQYMESHKNPWFQTTDQYGYPYDKPEWINDKWRMNVNGHGCNDVIDHW